MTRFVKAAEQGPIRVTNHREDNGLRALLYLSPVAYPALDVGLLGARLSSVASSRGLLKRKKKRKGKKKKKKGSV